MLSKSIFFGLTGILQLSSGAAASKITYNEPGQAVLASDSRNHDVKSGGAWSLPELMVAMWPVISKTPNTIGNIVDAPGLVPDWWIPKRLLNKNFPDPDLDVFYKDEGKLHEYSPGQVIKFRDGNLKELIKDIWGITGFIGDVKQIYYRTTDTHGNAQGTVATVIKPLLWRRDPAVLAQQSVVDAPSLKCCQSWGLSQMSNSTGWLNMLTPEHKATVTTALKNGHYVVISDFQGPQAAFGVGRQAGHAILDGVRAIINQYKLNKTKNPRVVLNGYSGGGHATVWAANLAPTYATDLNIVGAAYGGTPIDMEGLIVNLADKAFGGLGLAGLVGMANVYPEFNEEVLKRMNTEGENMMKHLRSGVCLISLLKYYAMNSTRTIWDYFPDDGEDILKVEKIKSTVDKENLFSNNPDYTVPRFARYIYHTQDDTVIPFQPALDYVTDQCKDKTKGAQIWFDQHEDGGGHNNYPSVVMPNVKDFIKKALNGKLPSDIPCGEPYPSDKLDPEEKSGPEADEMKRVDDLVNNPGFQMIFGGYGIQK